MLGADMAELERDFFAQASLITVDVFDTLLWRKPHCEGKRLRRALSAALRDARFGATDLDALLWARTQARRLGYRALAVVDATGDVTLDAMVERTVTALGLPAAAREPLIAAELEEEIASTEPNQRLIEQLAAIRKQGKRVVALSDIWYSSAQLESILAQHGVMRALDAVYTSATLDGTKRSGVAFELVAAHESVPLHAIVHLGDDAHADGSAPRALGVRSSVTPREPLYRARLAADGLVYAARSLRAVRPDASVGDTIMAGLGPITAEYALCLWMYLASLPAEQTVALFCARGGLRLQLAFETLVKQLGLPSTVRCEALMVSRLAAMRGALLRSTRDAFAELEREFEHDSCAKVARAIVPGTGLLSQAWNSPFTQRRFEALLRDDPAGPALRTGLAEQHALFERHLQETIGDASRLLLCDTGLYGSTQRLLEASFPAYRWESVLLARSNYKRFDDSHFARATGLLVEQDAYTPLQSRSVLLRHWQLMEALFEPKLDSVRSFSVQGGRVHSNLERAGWRDELRGESGSPFADALRYIEQLRPGDAARVLADARRAWRRLHQAIVFPLPAQVAQLELGARPRDLGRDELKPVLPSVRRLSPRALRDALWKEGLIAKEAGALRGPALLLLEAAYTLRGIALAPRKALSSLGAP